MATTFFRCCCCFPCRKPTSGGENTEIVEDNCCQCNYAALDRLTDYGDIQIVYVTYHVDIGQTPFFVAIDFDRKKIVISIRGTLSMKVRIFFTVGAIFVMFSELELLHFSPTIIFGPFRN